MPRLLQTAGSFPLAFPTLFPPTAAPPTFLFARQICHARDKFLKWDNIRLATL
jgi:hypothetical protein